MNKNIIKVLAMLLYLVLVYTTPVYAESSNPFKISTLDISVMPEYDTSDVLVLYSINYVNTSSQPYNGEVRFQVPKGMTNNIVKETSTTNDNHLVVRVEEKADYAEFVWKPSQPIQSNASYPIHLEYYYNPLPGSGNKAFTYQFRATMPVDQAKINVFQPLKATDFKMEPVGRLLGQDNQGFQVYGLNSANLKNGDKVDLKVTYTKDDPNPSVQKPGSSGATGQPAQTGRSQLSSSVIIIPTVALVVIIVIIVVKAFSNREMERETANRRVKSQNNREESRESKLAKEKRKLRQKLLNGEISEGTYHEL
ncbi:MAG: hypothetical protein M0Z31_10920, partial [Clostridia bacterium]|nr:hypothetical protein [Clostridia bacterium]